MPIAQINTTLHYTVLDKFKECLVMWPSRMLSVDAVCVGSGSWPDHTFVVYYCLVY